MEMYVGKEIWLMTLPDENRNQKSTIHTLRAKYLAKILLLPCNLWRNELIKAADQHWKKQQKKQKIISGFNVKVNIGLMRKFEARIKKEVLG